MYNGWGPAAVYIDYSWTSSCSHDSDTVEGDIAYTQDGDLIFLALDTRVQRALIHPGRVLP